MVQEIIPVLAARGLRRVVAAAIGNLPEQPMEGVLGNTRFFIWGRRPMRIRIPVLFGCSRVGPG